MIARMECTQFHARSVDSGISVRLTSQHFCDRVGQHKRDVKNGKMSNGFYAYIRRNKGHTVEWKDAVFIDREKHWKGRKIKEALYIHAQN